jgi:hypothetical protein
VEFAVKDDIQQFRDACRQLGIKGPERRDFGKYIHELKQAGILGTANDKGDFTWEEMLELGRDFLSDARQ